MEHSICQLVLSRLLDVPNTACLDACSASSMLVGSQPVIKHPDAMLSATVIRSTAASDVPI